MLADAIHFLHRRVQTATKWASQQFVWVAFGAPSVVPSDAVHAQKGLCMDGAQGSDLPSLAVGEGVRVTPTL